MLRVGCPCCAKRVPWLIIKHEGDRDYFGGACIDCGISIKPTITDLPQDVTFFASKHECPKDK